MGEVEKPEWTRPSEFASPQIWLKENGFVVRDVTPDMDKYVFEHMVFIN